MITKSEISAKAFNMFRDWSKNVYNEYSELDLTIIDESILINNLIKSIKMARNTLINEEKKEQRDMKGYDLGFMQGFIESNLNSQWEYEYIIKQSAEYKQFIAIKAIKNYLEFDTQTANHIYNIYKYLMTNESNLENIDLNLSNETIDELSFADIDDISSNAVIQMLNNRINIYIKEYLRKDRKHFMEPCEKYFSDNEIKFIIDNGINI